MAPRRAAAARRLQLLSGKLARVLHEDSLLEFFSYATPSFIYFINNNCIFFILQAVDPTTFQLLSQMKTIFTGLLFRVLKRQLTKTLRQSLAGLERRVEAQRA